MQDRHPACVNWNLTGQCSHGTFGRHTRFKCPRACGKCTHRFSKDVRCDKQIKALEWQLTCYILEQKGSFQKGYSKEDCIEGRVSRGPVSLQEHFGQARFWATDTVADGTVFPTPWFQKLFESVDIPFVREACTCGQGSRASRKITLFALPRPRKDSCWILAPWRPTSSAMQRSIS